MLRNVLTLLVLSFPLCVAQIEYVSPVQEVLQENVGLSHANLLKDSMQDDFVQLVIERLPFVQNRQQNVGLFSAPPGDDNVINTEYVMEAENYNVSSKCLNDTMTYFEGILQQRQWAIQMLDAQAKLPSGILDGNRFWLGSYSGCQNVTAIANVTEETLFKGRYCAAQIPLGSSGGADDQPSFISMGIEIGLCVPSSCNPTDVTGLINTALSLIPLNATNIHVAINCPEKPDVGSDGRAIAAIVICSIIGAAVLLGTLYDVCFIQIPVWLSKIPGRTSADRSHMNFKDDIAALVDTKLDAHVDHNKHDDRQPGMIGRLLLAFSMYTNGSKILNTAQAPGSLTCLHGIRFLSMSWVILGHGFVIGILFTDNFAVYAPKIFKRWTFQAVLNGTFSVDTFFFLSGLLVAFLTLKEMNKTGGRVNWALFYFHRFWRLTPTYMLILMVDICLFRYFGEGPLWPKEGVEMNYCRDTWWQNLLYINNFFVMGKSCMSWTWYLANDMQFFIISPLILILFYRSKVAGGAVLFTLLIGSFITTGVISTVNDLPPSGNDIHMDLSKPNYYQDLYYQRPYCRIAPYLIGMITGYILQKTGGKITMSTKLALVGWVLAFVCNLAVLYGLYGHFNTERFSTTTSAVYIRYPALAGHWAWLGFINTFLSWSPFVPLGRLTYCAYLIHPLIMIYYSSSGETVSHASDLQMIYFFLGNIVMSYGLAFIASLVFEAPFLGLEKILLPNRRKSRKM